MNPTISATLTRCRNHLPLVVLDGPFNGMEVRPKDLHRMAAQLSALAQMAERLPASGKHFIATRVTIDHTPVQTAGAKA